jgi:hypothetical protein
MAEFPPQPLRLVFGVERAPFAHLTFQQVLVIQDKFARLKKKGAASPLKLPCRSRLGAAAQCGAADPQCVRPLPLRSCTTLVSTSTISPGGTPNANANVNVACTGRAATQFRARKLMIYATTLSRSPDAIMRLGIVA